MEFLKSARKRSFLSEFTYTGLNIAFAVAISLIVWYTQSVVFALLLVLLSKWRIFAVRPRYWWANLRSNMVDIIVNVSLVLNMHTVVTTLTIPESGRALLVAALTALYIGWLLFVKPRSKRVYVVIQAGSAIFLGTTALFTVAYNWPVSLVVLGMWLIGYTAARHILSSYDDETHSLFLGLVWGLILAEIAWVSYHWAIAYPLPIFPALLVPQVAIIATLVSFLIYKVYDSFYHHAKIRMTDILMPLLFTVGICIVVLVLFNRVGTAI